MALAGCSSMYGSSTETESVEAESATPSTAEAALDAALEAQSDDAKARYQYRHPKETLMFFGVEPGMTVVDTLPGEPGWYGNILTRYLGANGVLIGAEYSIDMWSKFGGRYGSEEHLEDRRGFTEKYVSAVADIAGETGANADAFMYGSLPDDLEGTADVVLMVRAAHHFNRIEDGRYFTEALDDIQAVLKPGGIVGVVQHRAPEGNSDEWAVGNAGYLKQSHVISVFEEAGFELVEASEINANPNDQPTEEDIVWRLPPSLGTSGDNDDLRAQMQAIGESDRMTLKFKKPE